MLSCACRCPPCQSTAQTNGCSQMTCLYIASTALTQLHKPSSYVTGAVSISAKTPRVSVTEIGCDVMWLGMYVQTGIQEKTTLVQLIMKPAGGMYTAYFVLPSILELLVLLVGITVLFHHTEPSKGKSDQSANQSFLEEGGASSHEES